MARKSTHSDQPVTVTLQGHTAVSWDKLIAHASVGLEVKQWIFTSVGFGDKTLPCERNATSIYGLRTTFSKAAFGLRC